MKIIALFTGMFALGSTIPGYAQETMSVGELLAKGGKKMTKEQVSNMYTDGVTVSGLAPGGNRKFELKYMKNGTVSGHSTDIYGLEGRELSGKWTIKDDGQFCAHFINARTGRDATPGQPCSYRILLNDAVYSIRSEDSASPAFRLTIKK